jgi:ketosteroid isomerase-like protein
MGASDRDEYVSSMRVFAELSPDVTSENMEILAWGGHGRVVRTRVCGTQRDAGPFENDFVWMLVTGAGRIRQIEVWSVDEAAAALVRFEELRPPASPVSANAATRATDRGFDAFDHRDWDAFGATLAPTLVYEDRRSVVHTAAGRDDLVTTLQFVGARPGIRCTRELAATAGDRLALQAMHWFDPTAGEEMEFDHLTVTEVGADGLTIASIVFDVDDRVEAFDEMLRRFASGEAADHSTAAHVLRDLARAVLTPDWDLWRALLADDCTLHDRRTAGIGMLSGPEWVEAQRVMSGMSPDVTTTATEVLELADHGWISRVRIAGTLADGGPFESDHVDLFTIAGGRIASVEMFDPDAVPEARARFEELRRPP